MNDHDKKKAIYDKLQADHRDKLTNAGVPYREADVQATKLMDEAAERLDRRKREG
jgi:hypothetical protein